MLCDTITWSELKKCHIIVSWPARHILFIGGNRAAWIAPSSQETGPILGDKRRKSWDRNGASIGACNNNRCVLGTSCAPDICRGKRGRSPQCPCAAMRACGFFFRNFWCVVLDVVVFSIFTVVWAVWSICVMDHLYVVTACQWN